ncbi:hypothetical protein QR680_016255 [Steinernema hermaphroditum]|uniref:Uncharacterized protein n=1 Tax=Steinernema hermaphroditum TaxID=289476 RepID=A0AA39HBP9_9BILA|nr:hypothetical protein QR680_016255 [Steinernema hermaphroditum]
MFFFSLCPTCGLSKRKKKKAKEPKPPPEDDDPDNTYGVIPPPESTTDGAVSAVSFRNNGKQRSFLLSRYSQPPANPKRAETNSRKSVPSTSRELPSLPAFSNAATNLSGIPHIDDSAQAMYESLDPDDESVSDPVYSKVEDNSAGPSGASQKQYDYPIFSKHRKGKKMSAEDPLYQSASQIYTAGSEDPYSSIVSEGKNDDSSGIYDVGYAKVHDKAGPSTVASSSRPAVIPIPKSLDHLYSKIKRDPTRKRSNSPSPGPSHISPSTVVLPASAPNTRIVPIIMSNTTARQENESGSGSIVGSDLSREPSYRYITVRESIDVVRDRVNRQQQQQQQQQEQMQRSASSSAPIREHYYSTIGNDYESVGESTPPTHPPTAATLPPSGQRFSINRSTIPSVHSPSSANLDPLTLSVGSPETPPKPPTSPIPDRYGSRQNTDTPRSAASNCDVVTVIADLLGDDGAATQMLNDGISMGAELLSGRRAQPSSSRRCQTTQTREIPFKTSGIPVAPVHRKNSSSCQDISTQTATERRASTSSVVSGSSSAKKKAYKMSPSRSMPMPTAQDYVSPIDLGTERNWPLCTSR